MRDARLFADRWVLAPLCDCGTDPRVVTAARALSPAGAQRPPAGRGAWTDRQPGPWPLPPGVPPESGGTADGSPLPGRPPPMTPPALAVLRYTVFTGHGTPGTPEDVVPGDRALAVIGLVRMAPYGLVVADL
ncbi:hypothetical protein [Streptomyces sp. NPDC056227]|uniref:hypothetical protein n=1 Tax=Streptomyces sp. NPDC056227 TaxID=3345753 RepID=UPI0035D757FB